MRRLCLALITLATGVLTANAQLCSTVNYGSDKACSFTGVNGNCTLIVDRMRVATPPTIYVRRGSIVTLKVINSSSLEKLELDQSSITTQIPIDAVQALAPLLTQLGQFALPLQQLGGPLVAQDFAQNRANFRPAHPLGTPLGSKSFADIQTEQSQLAATIDAAVAVDPNAITKLAGALAVLRVLLTPPLDGCNADSDWNRARGNLSNALTDLDAVRNSIKGRVGAPRTGTAGAGVAMDQLATQLAGIQADVDLFSSGMAASQKKSDDEIAALKTSNTNLQKQIDDEGRKPRPDAHLIQRLNHQIALNQADIDTKKADASQDAAGWQVQFDQLKTGLGVLNDKFTKAQAIVKTVLFPAQDKLQALVTAINNRTLFSGPFPITDVLHNDKNDQQEVFTLNAVNGLTDPVKIFVASAATDPYSQTLADSIVATAPTKTAVMQATVQYVTQPVLEVTAGVLVPFLPYKSYTAASQSAGSATLVAQETDTYTIIPAVDLNFRLGNDRFAGNKRYGWFGTVAVGYNPATTMVEIGVGPSFALKSMVFSFLADVGRDTALASGFTKNQPLPGVATTPATNGVWSVKPSFGFSIRLPFNSGSGH